MKVSVIVPVYNVESYIDRCVESILAQSFADFELILVDDGSPDNCGAICDSYAESDSRVRVIHQSNGGLSAARNAGIDWAFANSDSEWIMFVDSDDWIAPETLELLYQANMQNGTDVSSCNFVKTDSMQGDPPDPGEVRFQCISPEKYYCEENVQATVAWGKLYRKSCFRKLRYPVGKIHEDEFVTYKILFDCRQIAVTAAALYFYFQRPDSIMQATWSPERMAYFEAAMEQVRFFKARGMNHVAEKQLGRYFSGVHCQISGIEKSDILDEREKTRYIRLLKKMTGRALRKYGKEYCPIEGNYYPYELAFPKRMKLYWYKQAFLRKLHFNLLRKKVSDEGLMNLVRKCFAKASEKLFKR